MQMKLPIEDKYTELKDNKKTKVDNNIFNTDVYDQIARFLRDHKQSSSNTADAYERDIKKFFKVTRNKEVKFLKEKDLVFTIEEFEDYKYHLLNKEKLSASTVNRHLTAVSECMRHLNTRGLVQDISFLDIRRAVANPNSYDMLTYDEIKQISNYVATTGQKRTGLIKKTLIEFTYDTCMRLQESLSLNWSDFDSDFDSHGFIKFKTRVKGNKTMTRRISKEVYDKLKRIENVGKDKVFDIGEATVNRMMSDIRKFLGIENTNRNIVFHSIRKAGAQWLWETTRDINQVSKALGHESIQTTELYINKNEDYGVVGALSSRQGVCENLFKKVRYKELVEAIGQLPYDKKMMINMKIKELNESV